MLTDFSPGNIDRYQIRSRLGGGGMGDLYLAWDPNTNRLVAIKLLNANLNSGDLRERFAREARALAALDNHPNIVVIHDYGDFQGSPYIVMEYVRGESLAEKIKRRAALTTAQKLKMMAELCAGLAHVHEVGIVHRDIKPANLMVEGRGRLKILDFGIARVAEGGLTRIGPQMTHVNMRIGTPGYMSPEQIDGRDIDHRSDLFAVGTVLYELLAYREAFTGKSTRQIENMVLEAQPKPLESLVHDIDPQIVAIVARALEKDPDHRFQTAEEFERALEEARSRLAPAITTPAPARQTPTPPGGAARGSRGARADAAYQRAVVVLQDGANDASRRFAIEALAEDPNHLGARALLDRLDPDAALWTPAASTPQSTLPPTSVASPNSGSPTIVRTQVSPAAAPAAERYRLLWTRYRIPAAIGASLVLAAGLVAGVVRATGWLSSGHSLSITKPSGGTITLRGQHITCGTFGSDCLATLPNNELVELEVQADPGFVFATYTGDCAPGDGPR